MSTVWVPATGRPRTWGKPRPADPRDVVDIMLEKVQEWSNGDWVPCDVQTPGNGSRALDITTRRCERSTCRLAFMFEKMFNSPLCRLLSQARVDLSATFKDFEILRYVPGGFFRPHADRKRGRDHIGTLLYVVTAKDVVGGELIVQGVQVGTNDEPFLAFIPLDVEHEVKPILSGSVRLVAKASVIGRFEPEGWEPTDEVVRHRVARLPKD